MKTFILLLFLFVSMLPVSACRSDENEELVEDAKEHLLVSGLDAIKEDFWLPVEGRDEVKISWEADQSDYVHVTDVHVVHDGQKKVLVEVTRPEEGKGHVDIVLTATLFKEDAEMTKEFEGVVFAMEMPTVFGEVEDLHGAEPLNELVRISGTVIAAFDTGYLLWDGAHALHVDNDREVDLGDEIQVTAIYTRSQGNYRLTEVRDEEILAVDKPVEVPVQGQSIYDFMTETDWENPLKQGTLLRLTGVITEASVDGETQYVLEDLSSDKRVFLHPSSALQVLEDKPGEIVTLEAFYHQLDSDKGPLLLHLEDNDFVIEDFDLEEMFSSDLETLKKDTYIIYDEDLLLPKTGANDTRFTDWTSSDPDIITDEGELLMVPDETLKITFRGEAQLGDYKETVVVDAVVAPHPVTIKEALVLPDGEKVHVQGVVIGWDYHWEEPTNLYIQDPDDGTGIEIHLSLEEMEMFADVSPGNKISVFGTLGRHTAFGNNMRQIMGEKTLISNDEKVHDIYVEQDYTATEIIEGFDVTAHTGGITNARVFKLEDVVAKDIDPYGYVFIESEEDLDMRLTFSLELAGIDEEDLENGELHIGSMVFITQRIHFNEYRVIVLDVQFPKD